MFKKRSIALILMILTVFFGVVLTACSTIQGKSAYEIACDNGFVGTELEWLESLKGENGKDGIDGQNGVNGLNGKDGQDGTNSQETCKIDIYDLYDAYLDEYPNATFKEFLESYSVVNIDQNEDSTVKAMQSIVTITSTFSKTSSWPGQSSPTEYSAEGSGVVYQIRGDDVYIITNYHVIYDRSSNTENGIANSIELFTYGQEDLDKAISASFVGGSITKDIAILKADFTSFHSEIRCVDIFDSNKITLGEKTFAIGNPMGEGFSVTSGIISVDSEEIEMEALDSASSSIFMRVIRTDASVNGGNSGGGMFNRFGQLIGIVNAKVIESGVENVGYAIPSNVAIGIANSIILNDSKKCIIGIAVMISDTVTQYNIEENRVDIIETIVIDSVSSGTLADGNLLQGDKLLSARINDGETLSLTRLFHLSDHLYNVLPSDSLYLEIERDGTIMTIELVPQSTNFTSIFSI